MGKLVLIIGGARSGKSTYAQQLAQKISEKVAFIATAQALDEEMAQRINAHQKSRSAEWVTIEAPTGIREKFIEANVQVGVVLVDCLTLLVSNNLMKATDNNKIDEACLESLLKSEFDEIITIVRESDAYWILVTNEVGLGIVPGDPLSRIFRDSLGRVNQWMATAADEVIFMVAGIPIPIHQYRK